MSKASILTVDGARMVHPLATHMIDAASLIRNEIVDKPIRVIAAMTDTYSSTTKIVTTFDSFQKPFIALTFGDAST
jgi:hypothetical protein